MPAPNERKWKVVIWAASLLVAIVTAFLLLRPSPSSQTAINDLAGAIFDNRGVGTLKIVNGQQLLTDEQSNRIIKEVVRPYFSGFKVESVSTEKRTERHSSGLIVCKNNEGQKKYIATNAFEADNGGGIPLSMLLRKCWENELIVKTGSFPKNSKDLLPYFIKGIEQDGPKLEQIGITRIVGFTPNQGTWQEISQYFATRM